MNVISGGSLKEVRINKRPKDHELEAEKIARFSF